jgi:hypothetical protein
MSKDPLSLLSLSLEFTMDTTKVDDIAKTVKLLDILFPTVLAVCLLIGCIPPAFLTVQSAKELTFIRTLGKTKRRARTILVLEQVFLSIIGLALGLCALYILNGQAISGIELTLEFFVQLYLLCCVGITLLCASIVTNIKAVDLLHIKQ